VRYETFYFGQTVARRSVFYAAVRISGAVLITCLRQSGWSYLDCRRQANVLIDDGLIPWSRIGPDKRASVQGRRVVRGFVAILIS